jgi:hypothetical protein
MGIVLTEQLPFFKDKSDTDCTDEHGFRGKLSRRKILFDPCKSDSYPCPDVLFVN